MRCTANKQKRRVGDPDKQCTRHAEHGKFVCHQHYFYWQDKDAVSTAAQMDTVSIGEVNGLQMSITFANPGLDAASIAKMLYSTVLPKVNLRDSIKLAFTSPMTLERAQKYAEQLKLRRSAMLEKKRLQLK
jgi:hypothetical protein